MSISNVMRILASEWEIGYGVSISICIVIYLVYSILFVVFSRKKGYDIGVSGMIPIWNITIAPVKRAVFFHKKNKRIPEDEVIEL